LGLLNLMHFGKYDVRVPRQFVIWPNKPILGCWILNRDMVKLKVYNWIRFCKIKFYILSKYEYLFPLLIAVLEAL